MLLALLLIGLISGGSKQATTESPVLMIRITGTSGSCTIQLADRPVAYRPGMAEEIEQLVRSWPSRSAIVETGTDTPYRCMGGVIYALQRAQFEAIDMRVAGHSHVPLRVSERDGACEVDLEDSVYMLPEGQGTLEAHFQSLAARAVAVVLDADPQEVNFRCIRDVLVVAQQTPVRFGFVSEPPH